MLVHGSRAAADGEFVEKGKQRRRITCVEVLLGKLEPPVAITFGPRRFGVRHLLQNLDSGDQSTTCLTFARSIPTVAANLSMRSQIQRAPSPSTTTSLASCAPSA